MEQGPEAVGSVTRRCLNICGSWLLLMLIVKLLKISGDFMSSSFWIPNDGVPLPWAMNPHMSHHCMSVLMHLSTTSIFSLFYILHQTHKLILFYQLILSHFYWLLEIFLWRWRYYPWENVRSLPNVISNYGCGTYPLNLIFGTGPYSPLGKMISHYYNNEVITPGSNSWLNYNILVIDIIIFVWYKIEKI